MTWYKKSGNMSEVVLSTRARLARNISGFKFPPMLSKEDGEKIIAEVQKALLPLEKEFTFYKMGELSEIKRLSLVEQHMISPDFNGSFPRGVFINRDNSISIMVNEEDHLRIQCILPGLDIQAALDTVNRIDDLLSETLKFAFSEKYGFLTSCPTNAGTGLRISAMMHLPGINMTGGIPTLLSQAAREGIAIRGIYGEGSEAAGNLFQISNQVTLGISERKIAALLSEAVGNIFDAEKSIRIKLNSPENPKLIDKIYRAHGIMKSAYLMSTDELINNINFVRLGIYLGIINDTDLASLTELMVTMSPATLSGDTNMTSEQRDIYRARLIKNAFRKEG